MQTIRIDKTSPLIDPIRRAGYRVEESVYGDNTLVVYFPVMTEHFDRSKSDVAVWEQVENIAQMQFYWADNQVSATVTFKPEEAKDIPRILELYETRLKSIRFLPLRDHNYPQAPYQEISQETYENAHARIKHLDFHSLNTKRRTRHLLRHRQMRHRPRTPCHIPRRTRTAVWRGGVMPL